MMIILIILLKELLKVKYLILMLMFGVTLMTKLQDVEDVEVVVIVVSIMVIEDVGDVVVVVVVVVVAINFNYFLLAPLIKKLISNFAIYFLN